MKSFQRFVCCTFAALILGISSHARAAVVCVNNAADLQTNLTTAGSNGQSNTIKIVAGTYLQSSGNGFSYSQTGNFNLTIEGGFDGTCSMQTPKAVLTKLDGQSQLPVMVISNAAGTTGNVTIRYLTFQNGRVLNAYPAGLSVSPFSSGWSGDLRVENCLFRDNLASNPTNAYVVYAGSNSGNVYFLDNAIVDNIVSPGFGAVLIYGGGTTLPYSAFANNNTFANNTTTDSHTAAGLVLSGSAAFSLANNIVWDGSLSDMNNFSTNAVFLNNDIDSFGQTPLTGSTGNINLDPLFIDYFNNRHVQDASPTHNSGDPSPPGTVRSIDLDGNPRTINGLIDMGAYELQDVIFANGFE